MSGYVRRYTFDPGNEVLLEIESVNILDLDPPGNITGIGAGTAICVGEFENGPFAAGGNLAQYGNDSVIEVSSGGDLLSVFGGFGYTYAGVPAQNPSARARKADGALTKEYWNGNGAIQLNGKKFKRLLICRVDTSIGSVELRREAYVTGGSDFRFNLEPGQIFGLDIGAGSVSATFSATAASVTSGAGAYPTAFVGGETLTLGYDGVPNFTVTFLSGDTTQAKIISRINLYAGFSFAADAGAAATSLTGIQRGTGGQVRVVGGSAGVLVALGLVAANTIGTGNVVNIDAVSYEEIKAITEAAVAGTTVRRDSQGRLRVSKNYATTTDYINVTTATTAAGLGFTIDTEGSNDGIANYRTTTALAGGFAGGETVTLGVDGSPDFTVTFGADVTVAAVVARINGFAGFTMASTPSGVLLLLRGQANGGQVRVISASAAAVLTKLGLVAKTVLATGVRDGIISAGQRLQTSAGIPFVTMQEVDVTAAAQSGVTASGIGPYTVKIRHALDDGTGVSALAGAINSTSDAPDLGAFQVVNPATTSAALTEAQIDAAYSAAFDATKNINTVAKEANIIWSSRQSNVVRRQLRSNVLDASKTLFGRMACIRPPLNTPKLTARSKNAEPGVGAYRDQRVVYCYPGVNTFVPPIAKLGTLGGDGFTADGNIDQGSDGWLASVMSQLNPEEDPGQLTSFTSPANGLETGPNAQNLQMEDYIAFKAAGICAPRVDDGVVIFQSGVTSVDPLVFPELTDINRRRMADFLEDSAALRVKSYSKKLATNLRRKAVLSEIRAFSEDLLGKNNPGTQRIAGFTLNDKDNSNGTLGQGLYRITWKVRTISSFKSIVLAITVGTEVEVEEVLPNAA